MTRQQIRIARRPARRDIAPEPAPAVATVGRSPAVSRAAQRTLERIDRILASG